MRVTICTLLLFALLASPARAAEGKYVLVRDDAFLHAAPRDDAPRARAATWPTTPS